MINWAPTYFWTTGAPGIAYYDIDAPVVLQVDASDDGLGGSTLTAK